MGPVNLVRPDTLTAGSVEGALATLADLATHVSTSTELLAAGGGQGALDTAHGMVEGWRTPSGKWFRRTGLTARWSFEAPMGADTLWDLWLPGGEVDVATVQVTTTGGATASLVRVWFYRGRTAARVQAGSTQPGAAVQVAYTVGTGVAPPAVKTAVLNVAAWLYANPGSDRAVNRGELARLLAPTAATERVFR